MKKYLYTGLCALALSALSAGSAYAALVPSMSLSAVVGTSQVTVTVFGADPNASVLLYYPSASGIISANIGTTNGSGYLSTNVDSSTYNIAANAQVSVSVDGQQSEAAVWPNYASTGTLSLNQNSITLAVGQSGTVSALVSAALSLSTNTNPAVAGASISGNQISITGFSAGSSNIAICAASLGCTSISVTVQGSGSSGLGSISLTQTTVSLSVGQSQAIGITGSGNYTISSNSDSGVASAIINGSVLDVEGVAAGSTSIGVCSANSSGTTCASVNVGVTASATGANTVTTTQSALTFTPTSVNLVAGGNQAVSISGGLSLYYVSANSSPSSVTASVAGNSLDLTGISFGGANVTVCSVNGQCGNVYAYVSPTSAAPAAATVTGTATAQAPMLSSFSVSSNDANGFMGSGSSLTFSFSTNQTVNIPSISVAGSNLTASGAGSGPYTASYTLNGTEPLPIQVSINFSNPNGSAGSAHFSIGNPGLSTTVSAPAPSCPAGYTCAAQPAAASVTPAASATFTEYLYDGSTGPQVTALQQRLTSDGLYSGPITGTFGSLTKAAVIRYQAKHGLAQVGVIGPATRELLDQGI